MRKGELESKIVPAILLTLILAGMSSTIELVPAEALPGSVHVSGRNIVDEFGRTITLRGFNLWGNDWGHGPDSPYMNLTASHMQQIKNWGFNFVKLVCYWTFHLEPDEGASGVYNEEFLGYMDWIIEMAWDAGLYIIISVRVCYDPVNMPFWAGWSTHDYVVYNQVDSGGTHGLQRFCNLWRMLVNRFDDHPSVIGYNPWMFPYHGQKVSDGDARVDLYNNNVSNALISAIRERSNKIIFWSPVHSGARDYTDEGVYRVVDSGGYGIYPPHWNETRVPRAWDDENMVYMIMGYGDFEVAQNPDVIWDYNVHRLEQDLAFGKSFQDRYDVPMMVNEGPGLLIHYPSDPDHPANTRPIRQDRLDMLVHILDLFDDYPKNWAYWVYSGQKHGMGVLENGVTLEESAIVPILMEHQAAVLEGDLDHNGVVNIHDLFVVANAFGTKLGDESWNPIADRNEDGKVGIHDLFDVARNFAKRI
jgi:hypothetical protein